MGRITEVVKTLIIINVIVFLGTIALPPDIKDMGAIHFPLSSDFQPFQLITSMFMHANFPHLLFNMLGLFFLGPMVERALGPKRFLMLYFASGIGANILHMLIMFGSFYYLGSGMDPELIEAIKSGSVLQSQADNTNVSNVISMLDIIRSSALGASGAVYGVLIAFATMFPNVRLMLLFPPIPIAAKYLAVGLVAIGVISGISGAQDGIGHWAHVGGAIIGFILIKFIWKQANLR